MRLQFFATYDGRPIDCSSALASLMDLRFFVSNVAAFGNSETKDVALLADDHWQTRDVALIDLEDGTGQCQNGSSEMNNELRGTVEAGDYEYLLFSVGVPFFLNHLDPLRAESPLDRDAMHWHWRSGYKFMRAGVATDNDDFWLHLGSTGCVGTVTNILRCDDRNRISVLVEIDDVTDVRVEIDLSALLRGVDLTDGQRTNCSSSPAEVACTPVFENMGLKFGDSEKPLRQAVFKSMP